MALSAASPFYRGYVSDIDCRWGVISASVDDRTQEERGLLVRGTSMICQTGFNGLKLLSNYPEYTIRNKLDDG